MSNLPPLPEPRDIPGFYDIEARKALRYTDADLRSYAEEAVRLEREACAKAADDVDEPGWTGYECPNTFNDGKWAAAAAIRARSQEGQG